MGEKHFRLIHSRRGYESAFNNIPPPPCDLGCSYKAECAEGLSCSVFSEWYSTGQAVRSPSADGPIKPSKRLYAILFKRGRIKRKRKFELEAR